MRVPIPWLVIGLFFAGCGNAQKNPQDTTPGAVSETPPGETQPGEVQPGAESAPTSTPPAGSGGPIKAGSKVTFHFVMKADGKVMEDSHAKAPASYIQGSTGMFPVLQSNLEGLKPGDKKSVTLKAEEAFGPRSEAAVQNVPRTSIPDADSLKVGQTITGSNGGQNFMATVTKIGKTDVTLDLNHPLAGKPVTFDVEIVSVE